VENQVEPEKRLLPTSSTDAGQVETVARIGGEARGL
jgi:hypothetical protein